MSSKALAFVVVVSLCVISACSRDQKPRAAATPNILVITVDTLRADRLGCYGYAGARTPNIDRLASEGVRVDHAVAPTPLTLPSHTSIMTGLEPPAHGVRDNGVYRVPDSAQTLAERLKTESYQTQAFVSAEVLHRRFNLNQGFDAYDDELWSEAGAVDFMFRERSADRTIDRVLEWLGSRSAPSAGGAPFFAWVHLFDPHDPHNPPEADAKLSPTPYDGEIAHVDRQIGRLLGVLEQQKILDDTIIVFTSDHGESLGEHNEGTHAIFIYESTVRVPLIFRYPHKLPAGKVYAGSARSVDIMPTVLALAGKKPGDTQGADLSAALASEPVSPEVPQYSESLHPQLAFGMAPLAGVRLNEWTYIRAPRPELYDRNVDPRELRNLLDGGGSDTSRAKATEMEALLTKITEASGSVAVAPEERPLDQQTAEMLKALGYMEDADEPQDLAGMDPKDGIEIFDAVIRGTVLVQQGNCPGAIRMLTSVLEKLPGHTSARNAVAQCEANLGNAKAAKEHYLKSLAHAPQQPDVFLQLARLELAQGQTENARKRVEGALELVPDSVDAMLLMGYLDLNAGDGAKATRWFNRAIAADPTRQDGYLQQGNLYFRKSMFEDALGWYEKALAASPQSYAAAMQAGMCSLQLGDLSAAGGYLQQAAQAAPSRWQPLYSLGCVEVKKGDSGAALTYLEKATNTGFRGLNQLQSDPCLAPLATESRFQNIVRAIAAATQP